MVCVFIMYLLYCVILLYSYFGYCMCLSDMFLIIKYLYLIYLSIGKIWW